MSVERPAAGTGRWSPVFIRLALAIPMIVSGLGKVANAGPKAMGIGGFSGFLASLGLPLPTVLAWTVAGLELLGGLLVLGGLFVRVVGLLFAGNMLVATVLVHLPEGYPASDGGIELTLTLLLVALALVLSGPGAFSLEQALFGEERDPLSGSGRRQPAESD